MPKKTHCINGHLFTKDNLDESYLKKGVRRCKICYVKYKKDYFQNTYYSNLTLNRQKGNERTKKYHASEKYKNKRVLIRRKLRQFIIDYKTRNGCECQKSNCWHNGPCKVSDPRVIDFHHIIKNKKSKNISRMVANRLSLITIIKEIEKCKTLCRNCHGLLTPRNEIDISN